MCHMARRLVSITADNADDLPMPCRACAFWECGDSRPDRSGKDDWLSAVLLDSGRCGKILYVDGVVAGFALYAPPEYVAGGPGLGASKVSDDAILLMTARILPEFASTGLGRVLIQSVVKDTLSRRGVKALEAYGDTQGRELNCVIPAKFLTAVGFKTFRPHPRFPLHRMELRSVLSWRGDVEEALERWLGAMRPEKPVRPVGASPRTQSPGD
jgi:GNAT superfamily N-acetyltransferase